ncbi:beta-ketoacyl-[acyl-carrier-protein] synthase family protein [Mesonia sp.]|uniref:beta-ketoacyl-[acyl-carrier-protein] synthase family protein n=1 Tax=Mesonia sp. TaxID=1960830 RepID=UPI001761A9C2|nr:beta-ketoacyl-[acyl-carrier-protein] synthase family protein [Mesonia sp.]HIB38349.1 beta-ketoacyl-[acyl-carrier-protein] synthase family protein [Mesonia sp.]HIO27330.1 beta-ketoacyl-[acyl-carrier-protein] synthase family protein [Flavobacteriaceae bacterium]
MSSRIAITGMGIVSAIGNNVQENLLALAQQKSGIGQLELLETIHQNFPCGEIKLTNNHLVEALKVKQDETFTRAALLGVKAAEEALQQAQITSKNKIAFVNGTSVGGMDYTEKLYKDFSKNPHTTKYIEAQHPGFTSDTIAHHLTITGLVTTVSTACSSGANALITGAKLLKAAKAETVLAGGTDCLSKFTLNGFNSLKILSEKLCQPFDEHRSGLNLGEGAAYLVLETEEKAKAQNKIILGYLDGYGNANDAYHQTASSATGEGSFLAMQAALNSAKINAREVSYINAHGTATENNDLSEGVAIQRIFEENLPKISSTKAFTGHTLAAAGAIEAVFSLLAIQEQKIWPNLNFKVQMPELNFSPETEIVPQKIEKVLSNSFGFGGNCSSLLFSAL